MSNFCSMPYLTEKELLESRREAAAASLIEMQQQVQQEEMQAKRYFERQEYVNTLLANPWLKAYMQRLVPCPELLHKEYPEVFA